MVEQATSARPPTSRASMRSRATRASACCRSRRSAAPARATPACAPRAATCSCSSTTTTCRRPDWLRRHEANFADPTLPRRHRPVRRRAGAAAVRQPRARAPQRAVVQRAQVAARLRAHRRRRSASRSLMGGNAAIPRRTLERFGLWDECTPIEDEPSLAYRINARQARRRVPAVRSGREDDPPARRARRHGEAHAVGAALRASACSRSCTTSSATTSRCGSCCSIPRTSTSSRTTCIAVDLQRQQQHRTLAQRVARDRRALPRAVPAVGYWLGDWAIAACARRGARSTPAARAAGTRRRRRSRSSRRGRARRWPPTPRSNSPGSPQPEARSP